MKNSGIVWSDKHLWMYLTNPGKYISGNKMSFAGIAEETEKAHLIAYLSSVWLNQKDSNSSTLSYSITISNQLPSN